MIVVNSGFKIAAADAVFCFALASEAAEVFEGQPRLITGIGKVNAAYELTKAIQQRRPGLIVNLGSAGSDRFQKGTVVCRTRFVQRDMDVRGLGYARYETPLSGLPVVLEYGLEMQGLETACCGTGDNFEMGHQDSSYQVVDMEAYALALVAKKEGLPFLCLKYISDGADDKAADDWTVEVHRAAAAFGSLLQLS